MLLKRLIEAGTQILTSTTLQALTDGGVCVKDEGGERVIPADLTVLAMGVRSDCSLRGELESAFDRVILVGDAEHPDRLRCRGEEVHWRTEG